MVTKTSPTLMNKKEDLERLSPQQSGAWQWGKGIHRYSGILVIKGQNLVFQGMDVRERSDIEETIPLSAIAEISLGSDGQFKGTHNCSVVVDEPKPLVIRYRRNGGIETDYFITNFPGLSSRGDGNQYWYEILKAAIDRTN